MPYNSVKDVPDSVPDAKRAQWLEVFNQVYAEMEGKGMTKAECESRAFAAANKAIEQSAAQAGSVLRAEFPCRLLAAADAEGKAWDVEIARVGVAESRRFEFTRDVLARDAGLFENAPSYRDHQPLAEMMAGKGRSIEDLIGYHRNPRMGDGALISTLHLLEPDKWAGKLRAIAQAPPGIGGMSVDLKFEPEPREGLSLGRVKRILAVRSVDLVSRPDAGGRVLRMVASNPESFEEFCPAAEHDPTAGVKQQPAPSGAGKGVIMKDSILLVLQALKSFDPAKAGPFEAEIASLDWTNDEKVKDVNERIRQAVASIPPPKAPEPAPAAGLSDADRKLLANAGPTIERAEKTRCGAVLASQLLASGLPVPLAQEIKRRYDGRIFEEEDLQTDIAAIRASFAQVVPAHQMADPAVRITLMDSDKRQIALDKTFGLTHEVKFERDAKGLIKVVQGEALANIPAFSGIREAYTTFTGDPGVTGKTFDKRITADFETSGFPAALAATLNRLLLKDYGAVNYHWQDLVTSVTAPADFRTQERVRVGYFDDIDTVLEGAPYTEIDPFTDEKITYAVTKRGNIATVTRETIINDDVGLISKIVGRLGRSAARTLAKFVWGFATAGATTAGGAVYDPDTTRWFHASHGGNTCATALSVTIATSVGLLNAADLVFFNQAEGDSIEKLGLVGPYLLVVPKALHAIAISINRAEYQDAIFTANPWYKRFDGPNGELNANIFANPLETDVDRWYLFDISGNVDIIEIGFLQGRQAPEIMLADSPTVGAMFTNDQLIYKVRHEYSGDLLDYRGGYAGIPA